VDADVVLEPQSAGEEQRFAVGEALGSLAGSPKASDDVAEAGHGGLQDGGGAAAAMGAEFRGRGGS